MLTARGGHGALRGSDGVATLTLNRPDRLNAIVPELVDALDAALDRAEADAEVRVDPPARRRPRLLRRLRHRLGRGGRWRPRQGGGPWDPIGDYQIMSRYVRAYMSLWRSPKPVIAQVHGFCVGGGTDLALCSDLIVCAEDCRIGYPPARVWGSPTTAMWIYRLGLERAKRLLLTGDALDGATRGRVGAGVRGAPGRRRSTTPRWRWPAASRSCPPTSCT